MNEFSLINENNVRFSLKDFTQKAFVPSIRGLGYKNNISFVKVGNYFRTDHKEIVQGTLSGSVLFNDYNHYQLLVNYVENAQALRLIYKPSDIEYFRDIEFGGITEVINKGSTTEAEIELICKSNYYTSLDTNFVVENVIGQSQYDLLFDYTFNDYLSVDIIFNNIGHEEAQMIVEFFGYIDKPTIELYQNNSLIYSVSFDKLINTNEKLIYSAQDSKNSVLLESEGVQTNVVSCLDLTRDNFFRIPRGTSQIVISSLSGIQSKIIFKIITTFKGV